jgi:arylsulfatase A-like enzyme
MAARIVKVILLCLFLVAIAWGPCEGSRPDPGAKSVILIVVDTLRVDRLGAYGHGGGLSPALDALAEQSTLFEQAYATAPWTTPSIASLLTAQYPRTLGITTREVKISSAHTTLAEMFQRQGYRSQGIISHSFLGEDLGFAQGFEDYNEQESSRDRDYVSSPGVSKEAIKYIRRNASRPFFLFLHYFDPHYNYRMHRIRNDFPKYRGRLLSNDVRIFRLRELSELGKLRKNDRRYLQALYDSEVRFTDQHIGNVIDELKKSGVYDNAMVVFVADHGEELGDGADGWVGHTKRLSQEMIHVPLIIKMPNQRKGRRVSTPVSLLDLMPTIAMAAKLRIPANVQGRPIDMSAAEPEGRPVFAETRRMNTLEMVIYGRHKLVYDAERERTALFDIVADPMARIDLAQEHPEVVRDLNAIRSSWSTMLELKMGEEDIPAPTPPMLDDDEEERLRELGYIQ